MSITTFGGCVPPISVPITYLPASNTLPVPGAYSVHVLVVGEDQRANTTTVGQVQAGYQQQPVVTSNDVGDAARDAVQAELQARGFVIGGGPTSSEVRVQVLRLRGYFFNSFFIANFTADLIMHVQVERPGKVITYSQSIEVTQSIRPYGILGGSIGDGFASALDAALKKAVMQLFDDSAFMDALLPPKAPTKPQTHGAKS